MIMGVTGGSGSGKSVVSAYFAKQGALVLDCDTIGHELLEAGGRAVAEVRAAFGEQVMDGDAVNRKALGEIVFSNEEKRAELNRITHRYITEELHARIRAAEQNWIVIDGALLFETGLYAICNEMVVVTAPDIDRIHRIMQRDGISEESAKNRLAAQTPQDEHARRADYVIANHGSLAEVYQQAEYCRKALVN